MLQTCRARASGLVGTERTHQARGQRPTAGIKMDQVESHPRSSLAPQGKRVKSQVFATSRWQDQVSRPRSGGKRVKSVDLNKTRSLVIDTSARHLCAGQVPTLPPKSRVSQAQAGACGCFLATAPSVENYGERLMRSTYMNLSFTKAKFETQQTKCAYSCLLHVNTANICYHLLVLNYPKDSKAVLGPTCLCILLGHMLPTCRTYRIRK